MRNFLQKSHSLNKDDKGTILAEIEKWCGTEEALVCMSCTLGVDLNLPMDRKDFEDLKPLTDILQVLILCINKPLVLLTLFDDNRVENDAGLFATRLSRALTSSLYQFCAHDFAVVSVPMNKAKLNATELKNRVCERQEKLAEFYRGPDVVSPNAFQELKKALELMAFSTRAPFHLGKTDKVWIRSYIDLKQI